MRVVTLFGTRPEIIRLSQVIKHLDGLCQQILIHTGQNFDPNLSDIIFEQLKLRAPDEHFGIRAASFAEQIGQILTRAGEALERLRPDRLLILGDTNSALAAVVAARLGIPVFHMEAGNRCYDNRVPEEINRRIVDHSSTVLMPYTRRSQENLVREGVERQRIYVVGNPIREVLLAHAGEIEASPILNTLGVAPGAYFLVTLHRAENVDQPDRLERLLQGLARIAETYPIPLIVSLHPRTADKLTRFGLDPASPQIRLLRPLAFFDFVKLEQHAKCVLSDSGTVQEECCLFGVPNVTVRDVTERPETIEAGSNILSGAEPEMLLQAVKTVLSSSVNWKPPAEYMEDSVSSTVAKILLGYHQP